MCRPAARRAGPVSGSGAWPSEEVDHLLDTRMAWYKARRLKSLMVTACALLAALVS